MPASTGPLAAFLAAARTHVDDALERYLPTPPACPALVSEAMRYCLFAGGKRLRPILTLAAGDAVARHLGDVQRLPLSDPLDAGPSAASLGALPAGCAIEMI